MRVRKKEKNFTSRKTVLRESVVDLALVTSTPTSCEMDLPPPLWSGGPGPASGERHAFPAPAASARCRAAASNAAASDLPTFRSQVRRDLKDYLRPC